MKIDILQIMQELGLTQKQLAKLMGVHPRSVGRWMKEPETIPGPPRHTLIAWQKLHRIGMAWGPHMIDIMTDDQKVRVREVVTHHIDLKRTEAEIKTLEEKLKQLKVEQA
jgi:transcriptional regulator with XRE-family HTH domain